MRKEYDFSNARPNPYVERLKQSVTIRLDSRALEYFKDLSTRTGIPYQTPASPIKHSSTCIFGIAR